MPNRVIREGWLESEPINSLDAAAERFFLRLCLRADDFGRFHASPSLLRSLLFPLKDDIRSTDIPRQLAACETAGLLRCYVVDGKPYLEIRKFDQRMRAANSKFPPPDDDGHMTVICQTHVSHPRTEAETKSEAEDKGAPRASASPVSSFSPGLDTPEFAQAWADWLKHRSEMRHPVKPGSQTEIATLRALSLMGVGRAVTAIRHTIFKGWRGIREPDAIEARQYQGGAGATPLQPIREPDGWKSYLNHTYPDSRFAAGQQDEVSDWSKLPRDVQTKLAGEIRQHGR
jgi:hypothetical protein